MWRRSARRRAERRLRLARYWQAAGDLDEAARHAERAVRLLEPEHVYSWAAASVTRAQIERDRLEYGAGSARLAAVVEVLDAQPAGPVVTGLLGRALVSLGDVHRRAGRYPDATAALNRACEVLDGSALGAALTVLAITCKELGDFPEAARLYERVRHIHEETRPTPAEAATLQHNLAGLAFAQEAYERAEVHARQAVALRGRAAAVDQAADLAVLGAVLGARGQHREARACLERAYDVCRRARPPRRYEMAVHLHTLAATLEHDDPERAEALYRQALALKEHLLGPEHPEVAVVCNNLAGLLNDRQRTAEAIPLLRRALAIAGQAFPPDHPTTAAIRRNLSR